MSVTQLPRADQIRGLSYTRAPDPRKGTFQLQYKTASGDLFDLEFDAMNGLYLLNLLEAAAKDAGIEHLRRAKL